MGLDNNPNRRETVLALRKTRTVGAEGKAGVLKKYLVGAALAGLVFLCLTAAEGGKTDEPPLESASGAKRIGILVELSTTCRDRKQALTYGREALELLESFPNPKLRVNLLNHLCEVCQYLGKYQASRDYAKQCLEITEKNNYQQEQAEALYYIGRSYYNQSIYDLGAGYLSRAGELYIKLGDHAGAAKTQNTFGMIHLRLGNYPRAMEYLLQALKIYETLGLDGKQTGVGLAYTNNNIGFLYYSMGHYNSALEYYLKARKLHESLNNSWGIAIVLNNIAEIYREKKEYNKALDRYKQSLQLKQELGNRQGTATTLHNIGKVYEEMENYPDALDYFKKSLTIREDLDDQIGIYATLIHVGRINRKSGQYGAALEQVNRAMDIAIKANAKTGIRDAYRELSEIIAAYGDYSKALYYYKKYKEINDSIFNETSSKRIAELQTQYQIEKNEKEIALLKKNKDIRELALKRGKNINFFIISTSGLFFIILFVLFTRWRIKAKMTLALDKEIREHKRTEKKLHESEEKFRRLAEASNVGIYISQDNTIQYVNPNLLSLFGYTREELVGRSPLVLVQEVERGMVQEKMAQRLSDDGDTPRYEFRGITKEGELLHLESYGGATRFQGKPAVLETVIDISNRKKTAEKLLKSQKLEAMGILAGGIAHDFNNLLVAMVGYLGTVKEKIPRDTPGYEPVENIDRAHNQAAELGRQLIDFSKGGWILPKPVSLTAILKGIVDTYPEMEALIGGIAIPGDLKCIYGDERQLTQVLVNLLLNAKDAKLPGKKEKPHVNIEARNTCLHKGNPFSLTPGDYVRVSLQDNGKGIPPERLENIFEPFFSGKAGRGKKGMGLGLAVCHSIVKKHRGHISFRSKVGKGTTAELILPANSWITS